MNSSVIPEVADDKIEILPHKNISGFSKTEKRNIRRNLRKRRKRDEERQQRTLPVVEQKEKVIQAVSKNQVTVIVAETGCGKSSQVPQILLQAGLAGEGSIVCTQPRRVAAWSLATRVADEMDCELGEEVGYHVRFERVTSAATRIAYVTDGVLLQQCLYDKQQVARYSLVIIDEVHERSLQLDLLLGVMRREIQRRQDLKLIIMSATMNTDIFSTFFDGAPVVRIAGSHHPVQVKYDPGHTLDHILSVIEKVVVENEPGDMLVFLPGRADIDAIAVALGVKKRYSSKRKQLCTPLGLRGKKLFVVEAHSELPDFELDRIFERATPGHWKIILATNIAESSLTVEGLRFVIDSGFVNVKVFDGKTGVHRLITRLISKSEAEQRKGRVGRTQPGECYRLYNKSQFVEPFLSDEDEEKQKKKKTEPYLKNLRDFPQPMVEREDLSQLCLIMRRYGFKSYKDFPFISPSNIVNAEAAEADLTRLGTLKPDGSLTSVGEKATALPLHPRLSAALLEAALDGCGYGMVLLASMMSAFSGGRRVSLEALVNTEEYGKMACDEVEALMLLLDDFKEMKVTPGLARWFWDTYELKVDYLQEAVSVYRQLKHQLEQLCGCEIVTPDKYPDAALPTFDVRSILEKIFEPNIATKGSQVEGEGRRTRCELKNGLSVLVCPRLCREYPSREAKFCGIEIFAVVDERPSLTNRSAGPYLTPSFRMKSNADGYDWIRRRLFQMLKDDPEGNKDLEWCFKKGRY